MLYVTANRSNSKINLHTVHSSIGPGTQNCPYRAPDRIANSQLPISFPSVFFSGSLSMPAIGPPLLTHFVANVNVGDNLRASLLGGGEPKVSQLDVLLSVKENVRRGQVPETFKEALSLVVMM